MVVFKMQKYTFTLFVMITHDMIIEAIKKLIKVVDEKTVKR